MLGIDLNPRSHAMDEMMQKLHVGRGKLGVGGAFPCLALLIDGRTERLVSASGVGITMSLLSALPGVSPWLVGEYAPTKRGP